MAKSIGAIARCDQLAERIRELDAAIGSLQCRFADLEADARERATKAVAARKEAPLVRKLDTFSKSIGVLRSRVASLENGPCKQEMKAIAKRLKVVSSQLTKVSARVRALEKPEANLPRPVWYKPWTWKRA